MNRILEAMRWAIKELTRRGLIAGQKTANDYFSEKTNSNITINDVLRRKQDLDFGLFADWVAELDEGVLETMINKMLNREDFGIVPSKREIELFALDIAKTVILAADNGPKKVERNL